jgi:predicted PurR-regulated permease PerM
MKLTRWFMYLLFLVLLAAGIMFYSWIFKYLISAVIFAYILNPWVSWLERRKVPRLAGIILAYFIIGAFIAWIAVSVLPVIISQAQSLLAFIKANSRDGNISLLKVPFIQNLLTRVDYLDTQVPILKLHDQFISLTNSINDTMINIPDILINNYQKILEAISLIATIPLIGFFLLKDNVKFRSDFLKLIPNRYFEIVIIILHKIDEVVGKYLRAMFYEILIVGTLASVVLTSLGVPYGFMIGFLAGFANIIPYFGPWMGALLAILSVLMGGLPPVTIIYVGIGMYLIQVLDNNIVFPLVVGTSINMHPLLVLLTVLAGGWAYGLLGMLFSVPLVYLIYSLSKVVYTNLKQFKMI